MSSRPRSGLVLIGRNEGGRLLRSLAAAVRQSRPLVYVDSGSSDGSVAAARRTGADIVELSSDRPLSAARARNAGFRRLVELAPELEFVQFVDGDCELSDGWLDAGSGFLAREQSVAAVCGYCAEAFPDATIYNRMCDMEWDRTLGEVGATGGNVLLRAAALQSVGGYDESMIAGEEPDLCRRLREAGWGIQRIDAPMVSHDAAMVRFGQWWTRARRSGFVDAMNVSRHGMHGVRLRALLSSAIWGLLVPLGSVIAAVAIGPIALLVALGLYALFALRIFTNLRRDGQASADAALCAVFLIVAKLPQLQGSVAFACRRVFRREDRLIEYKSADSTTAGNAKAPADTL